MGNSIQTSIVIPNDKDQKYESLEKALENHFIQDISISISNKQTGEETYLKVFPEYENNNVTGYSFMAHDRDGNDGENNRDLFKRLGLDPNIKFEDEKGVYSLEETKLILQSTLDKEVFNNDIQIDKEEISDFKVMFSSPELVENLIYQKGGIDTFITDMHLQSVSSIVADMDNKDFYIKNKDSIDTVIKELTENQYDHAGYTILYHQNFKDIILTSENDEEIENFGNYINDVISGRITDDNTPDLASFNQMIYQTMNEIAINQVAQELSTLESRWSENEISYSPELEQNLNDPSAPAVAVEDPSAPAVAVEDPSAPAVAVEDPSAPAVAVEDPSAPAVAVEAPSAPAAAVEDPSAPAVAVEDPSAPAVAVEDPSAPNEIIYSTELEQNLNDPNFDPQYVNDPNFDPQYVNDPNFDPQYVNDHPSAPAVALTYAQDLSYTQNDLKPESVSIPVVETSELLEDHKKDLEAEKEKGAILDKKGYEIPADVAMNYVHTPSDSAFKSSKFFEKQNPLSVAFEDKGKSLASGRQDNKTIESMISIAKQKKWDSVNLKGTEEFRRNAWIEAQANGIKTKGYTPKEQDLAALQVRQEQLAVNKIEFSPEREKKTEVTLTEAQQAKVLIARSIVENIIKDKPESEKSRIMTEFDKRALDPKQVDKLVDPLIKKQHENEKDVQVTTSNKERTR